MANLPRVRVEINPKNGDRAFNKMFTDFKNNCKHILRECRLRKTFESRPEKKRRKARELEVARIKEEMKEKFLQGKIK